MIRINLLEIRKAAPERSAKLTTESIGSIAAIAVIVLSIAFVAYRSFALSQQVTRLKEEVQAADEELAQLKDALRVIEEHKAKKAALRKRVDLISQLKRRQRVPVHLLDQVSRELPSFLWLEGLEERGGKVMVQGKATTYNAVSNFYNNLAGSPYFSEVTLGNTQRVTEGVSFRLSCSFSTPEDTDSDTSSDLAQNLGASPRS
ncbi:MAG: PilN domain-containing protein [Acidobacteriota bacterium]|nr:MAG: PilN domain-containing protein [Acidobacteriota bacterium]